MTSRIARCTVAVFAAQLMLQCTSYEEGVSITVGLIHHAGNVDDPALPDGEPRVFSTNLGYQVTLTEARVYVERVTIFACGVASRSLPAPSVAHAHEPFPPTVAEIEAVLDLMVDDRTVQPVQVLRPPPGKYCGAIIHLGPAPHGELTLETFVLRGTYIPLGGRDPVAFELTSSQPLQTGITFDARDGAPQVYDLSPDMLEAQVAVGLDYTLWFDDIDFREPDGGDWIDTVELNLLTSIHHHDAVPR